MDHPSKGLDRAPSIGIPTPRSMGVHAVMAAAFVACACRGALRGDPGDASSLGLSPGTIQSSRQNWEGGGAYVWRINQADGTQGNNPGWDWINITGTLTLGASSTNPFTLKLKTLSTGHTAGEMLRFNAQRSYRWTIATASGGVVGFSADRFKLDDSAFRNGTSGGSFEIRLSGKDLNLVYSPAPPRPIRVFHRLVALIHRRWVEAGAACGLAVVTIGFFRWRMRALRRIHSLERESALASQRQEIARDLHDEIGNKLTQLSRLCGTAERSRSAPAHDASHREQISKLAESAVDSLGDLVWATNPRFDTLDDFVAYLREEAAQSLESNGITCRLDFPAEVPALPVSPGLRRHLLLVVKEALNNILKHADAGSVEIRLALAHGRIEIGIRDDGKGFAPGGFRNKGQGLANMRQRVAELGGTFALASNPGRGTGLEIQVPFPPAPNSFDPGPRA